MVRGMQGYAEILSKEKRVRDYKAWLKRVADASMRPGNLLFYDGHLIDKPQWSISREISVTADNEYGSVTYVFFEHMAEVLSGEQMADMKKRLRVLTDARIE